MFTLPTSTTSTTPAGRDAGAPPPAQAGWKPALPATHAALPALPALPSLGPSPELSPVEAMRLALETGAAPSLDVLAGLPAGEEVSCWCCLYGSLESLPWSEIPHPVDAAPSGGPLPPLPFAPELIASLGEAALPRLRRFTLLETRLTIEALEALRLEGVSKGQMAVFQARCARLGQLYQAWARQAGAGLGLTLFKGYLRLARHTFSSVVSGLVWAMTNK